MSKTRAWAIICLLSLTNMFCLFGWAMASKQVKAWQAFAVAEDSLLIQLNEDLKRWQDVDCLPNKGDRIGSYPCGWRPLKE